MSGQHVFVQDLGVPGRGGRNGQMGLCAVREPSMLLSDDGDGDSRAQLEPEAARQAELREVFVSAPTPRLQRTIVFRGSKMGLESLEKIVREKISRQAFKKGGAELGFAGLQAGVTNGFAKPKAPRRMHLISVFKYYDDSNPLSGKLGLDKFLAMLQNVGVQSVDQGELEQLFKKWCGGASGLLDYTRFAKSFDEHGVSITNGIIDLPSTRNTVRTLQVERAPPRAGPRSGQANATAARLDFLKQLRQASVDAERVFQDCRDHEQAGPDGAGTTARALKTLLRGKYNVALGNELGGSLTQCTSWATTNPLTLTLTPTLGLDALVQACTADGGGGGGGGGGAAVTWAAFRRVFAPDQPVRRRDVFECDEVGQLGQVAAFAGGVRVGVRRLEAIVRAKVRARRPTQTTDTVH
jgi:hypothetical protein